MSTVPPVTPTLRARWPVALALIAFGAAAGAVVVALVPAPAARAPAGAPPAAEKGEPGTVEFARDKWDAVGIRTEPVASEPLAEYAWRTGRVVYDEDRVARVSPPVEGVVVEVRVRLGEDVPAGAVLAVLDSREVGAAKLELVRARLAAAAERERAGWAATSAANTGELLRAVAAERAPAEIDAALKDKPVGERRQALMSAYTTRNQLRAQVASLRASAGAVAESVLRKAETECDAAEAGLRAVLEELRAQTAQQARQAELRQKEADAAHAAARTHLLTLGFAAAQVDALDPAAEGAAAARYEVRAPFAGTVVERRGVRSERVGPTVEMFRVADMSAVWVQADAYETDLPVLRAIGNRGVAFRAAAAGIAERPAKVLYAGDTVDRGSRALTLTATAPNPNRELKPGMFVEVGLPRGGSAPVVQVPASAVQRHEGQTFVFVHAGGDTFRRRAVVLGRDGGERVEVRSGLAAGEVVAVEGGFVLKSELLRDLIAGD